MFTRMCLLTRGHGSLNTTAAITGITGGIERLAFGDGKAAALRQMLKTACEQPEQSVLGVRNSYRFIEAACKLSTP